MASQRELDRPLRFGGEPRSPAIPSIAAQGLVEGARAERPVRRPSDGVDIDPDGRQRVRVEAGTSPVDDDTAGRLVRHAGGGEHLVRHAGAGAQQPEQEVFRPQVLVAKLASFGLGLDDRFPRLTVNLSNMSTSFSARPPVGVPLVHGLFGDAEACRYGLP